MSASAFVVKLGEACKKVRIGDDCLVDILKVFPELRHKKFKLTYFDDEVDDFVDVEDIRDVPAKSKLVVEMLPGSPEDSDTGRATESLEEIMSAALAQEGDTTEPVAEPSTSQMSEDVTGRASAVSETSIVTDDTVILEDETNSSVTSEVVFDPSTVPSSLRSKLLQSGYEPNDADDKSIIHLIHIIYTAKSYFPDAVGYRLLTDSVFLSFPRLLGSAETPEEVYVRKQKFKAKLKNRFKNCRRSVDNPVITQEREVRGIHKRKRPMEGMPGMCPPYKRSKFEAAQEAARYSHLLLHADDESAKKGVLKESFALRRHLMTRQHGRKTPKQMKEMFPAMFTESALWSDLGLIMGDEDGDELKSKVTAKAMNVCKEYAARVVAGTAQPPEGDELVTMLAHGCGTTMSELEDCRNSARLQPTTGRLETQDTEWDVTPESRVAAVVIMAAVHAVLYIPFGGPCKTLFEVLYNKALGFCVSLGASAKKVVNAMNVGGVTSE
ncbi:uncharacterized protein LOC122382351 [Amphibalanus amphitrite]|uniref:uncharacterized protein LOC122382351 n=1 Tax=Amphibalanus amphitrite TaxID=1232801 RepID=UPI001C8FF68B|nr:uncharacterized protein LOC122382351 [Amphibalanus amphitrite]